MTCIYNNIDIYPLKWKLTSCTIILKSNVLVNIAKMRIVSLSNYIQPALNVLAQWNGWTVFLLTPQPRRPAHESDHKSLNSSKGLQFMFVLWSDRNRWLILVLLHRGHWGPAFQVLSREMCQNRFYYTLIDIYSGTILPFIYYRVIVNVRCAGPIGKSETAILKLRHNSWEKLSH